MVEEDRSNETTAHTSTTSREEVVVVRFEESSIKFPYTRSLGPVIGAFMTALTEKKILGIRNGNGVLVPPMEWDPATGAELPRELVEVGPAGTVESWTWVPDPTEQHPLDRPFAFAFIRLDGASTPFLHAVSKRPKRYHNFLGPPGREKRPAPSVVER